MAFNYNGNRYESVEKPSFKEIFQGEKVIAEMREMPTGSRVDIKAMTSTEAMLVESFWALQRAGVGLTFEKLVNEEFEAIEMIEPPKPAEKPAEPEMILDPLDGGIRMALPEG